MRYKKVKEFGYKRNSSTYPLCADNYMHVPATANIGVPAVLAKKEGVAAITDRGVENMLRQILDTGYVDPELLRQLTDEQKEVSCQ